MPAPTLSPEQYQFTDTGVLLNDSPSLPFVDITLVDGLDSAPVRTSSTDREGIDGGFNIADYESYRTVTIEGSVYASVTAMETYLDQLKANFAPVKTPQPFHFGTDNGQRLVFARSTGFRYQKDQARRLGVVNFQVQLLCDDPRLYSSTAVTSGAFATTGSIVLSGNRDSNATLTISGAKTNPTITQGSNVFTFNATTIAGDTIVIDLESRTVVKNGTINLRPSMTITGGWYLLEPGTTNFTLGGSGTGTLTVDSRSAWR